MMSRSPLFPGDDYLD
jgi:mitogen-activated protein kinase 1/3